MFRDPSGSVPDANAPSTAENAPVDAEAPASATDALALVAKTAAPAVETERAGRRGAERKGKPQDQPDLHQAAGAGRTESEQPNPFLETI